MQGAFISFPLNVSDVCMHELGVLWAMVYIGM